MVMEGPPGTRVWLPMTYWPAESAVHAFPTMVKAGLVFIGSREKTPARLGGEVAGGIWLAEVAPLFRF